MRVVMWIVPLHSDPCYKLYLVLVTSKAKQDLTIRKRPNSVIDSRLSSDGGASGFCSLRVGEISSVLELHSIRTTTEQSFLCNASLDFYLFLVSMFA
jgi:hypothetical protein